MDEASKAIDLNELLRNMPQDQKDYLQFLADWNLLNQKLTALIKEHPDQWAGACGGEIIIAPTRDELIARFGEKAPRMAWAFLSSKKIGYTFLAAA